MKRELNGYVWFSCDICESAAYRIETFDSNCDFRPDGWLILKVGEKEKSICGKCVKLVRESSK